MCDEQIASDFENDIDVQCKEVNDRLKDMAYESVLNKSELTQSDRLEVG
ncbi:hypothetical protein [Wolbachia pipientis]|nr:hypothetical protein [Wolbachia pipientis]MDM8335130.1 hypothetical protein [Wolbachia pipientis]